MASEASATAKAAPNGTGTVVGGGGGSSGFGENVHISNHPVLSHKITIMRSSTTEPCTFRAALREVTYHLGYEATSRLTTQSIKISVPVPRKDGGMDHLNHKGYKLKERIALIPKIRSGLGMVDSMLELLPNAAIHHIGMYKVLGQHPVQYFNRLPRKCEADVAYILDPVISTSSTIVSLVNILKKWGVGEINIIAVISSRTGLEQLVQAHPDIKITIGTVDESISETGLVMPGLGDAGDRQFGTSATRVRGTADGGGGDDDDEDESLLHPSKRKRSMDDTEEMVQQK